MHYEGNIIRPPSEANSIILQVTRGCSHNKCLFCGAYKGVRFRLKDREILNADIVFASQYCKRQKRVFLADGDVLILPQAKLVAILQMIREKLPWVNRISLYGNAKSIRSKSLSQLSKLKSLGLDRVYMGLESGHDPTLEFIRKGSDAAAMIAAGRTVKGAGLFLSVTVLLGIGGTAFSSAHAKATGHVLTQMEPKQIGVLTLMLLENTPLYQLWESGRFSFPKPEMLLQELRTMVEHIYLKKALFQTNHASNYLPLNCRLSRDKEYIISAIDEALSGEAHLVPEHLRAL